MPDGRLPETENEGSGRLREVVSYDWSGRYKRVDYSWFSSLTWEDFPEYFGYFFITCFGYMTC